jgi:hypothetical protein
MKSMRLLRIVCLAVTLLISVVAIGDTSEVDPLSAACMSCHDGSGGLHVRFCLIGQKGKGCGGHIISASYADLAAKDKSLLPESSLPPEIALHEGKITCVTCHGNDPHLGKPLAMDNHDSALCRACHQK